jgi:uncharacterized protein YjbI with pentapeptide repeats
LLGWLLAGLALVAILFAAVLVASRLLYPPLTDRELDRHQVTDGKERIELKREQEKLQNDARGTLLQGLGGAVLVLGAYFTWRQVQTSRTQLQQNADATRNQLKLTRDQLDLAREGQLTERFTRAIDQLGSDHLDVSLGGIHALERIARDSDIYRATIGEVLSAYVRGHAPWPPTKPGQPPVDAPIDGLPRLRESAPDVQAAVTVLGRGGFAPATPTPLDLARVDLRRARLDGANLQGAMLVGANLQGAMLDGANLQGADLSGANLQGADLSGAYLQGAVFDSANLQKAELRKAHLQKVRFFYANLDDAVLADANLQGADLRHAKLQGDANLRGADLQDAVLEGANLYGADLHHANLKGAYLRSADLRTAVLVHANLQGAGLAFAKLQNAHASRFTLWPAGWNRGQAEAEGVRYVPE